ncbi:MAG: DUF4404 family protein [Gammaproteobacteria bacterium]|nr:DUF4404 family protein [Gammaproteobacteria bacterium]
MSSESIRNNLAALKQELAQTQGLDTERHTALLDLINQIETQLDSSTDNDNNAVQLKKSITEFETEYPRLTAILNDIAVTLSNLGI